MRPENTMAAFEYALDVGVDALEMDVAVTQDDVPVISHDPKLNPEICRNTGGAAVIRQITFNELRTWDCGSLINPHFPKQQAVPGARIPALEEVLSLASRGNFLFNIETKIFRDQPQYTPTPERVFMRGPCGPSAIILGPFYEPERHCDPTWRYRA